MEKTGLCVLLNHYSSQVIVQPCAPYRLKGCNLPWFICWLWRYISHLLTYFLTYLSTSLRIGPFCFQAGGPKRRPNLALVFCVYFVLQYIWLFVHVCICCVIFSFFSELRQEICWEERLRNDLAYFVSIGTKSLNSINWSIKSCLVFWT